MLVGVAIGSVWSKILPIPPPEKKGKKAKKGKIRESKRKSDATHQGKLKTVVRVEQSLSGKPYDFSGAEPSVG